MEKEKHFIKLRLPSAMATTQKHKSVFANIIFQAKCMRVETKRLSNYMLFLLCFLELLWYHIFLLQPNTVLLVNILCQFNAILHKYTDNVRERDLETDQNIASARRKSKRLGDFIVSALQINDYASQIMDSCHQFSPILQFIGVP